MKGDIDSGDDPEHQTSVTPPPRGDLQNAHAQARLLKRDRKPWGQSHGILIVDKPAGQTSHDVVNQARRCFRTRRIGHAGTLDPMATGVLVLLLGEATKLSSLLTGQSKEYLAEVTFGQSTDTLDAEGVSLKRVQLANNWLNRGDLDSALVAERDRRLQLPPAVSAIKVDGERAYKKARRGESVELEPRDIEVHDLRVASLDADKVQLRLSVSKGYYVRALARDLGDRLAVPSHLSSLRRVRSGNFSIEEATAWPPPNRGKPKLIGIHQAVRQALPSIDLSADERQKVHHGQALLMSELETPLPASAHKGVFGAFYQDKEQALLNMSEDGTLLVQRGFRLPSPDSEEGQK
ncbi:MAG: tRNA pseudouridine(55) synthase TruB [Polyangiaceae bacterium]|nr:tRNA pseudouridine(55) synthase TruB [Polyangiaceae bacterium]